MLKTDEDALICDFAETYHILDFRELPAYLAATLACGLRDDSRIKMKISGAKATVERMLMAVAADKLSFLAWSKTKDAERGRSYPKSLTKLLMGASDADLVKDIVSFETAEEWEAERERLIKEVRNNGDRAC